MRSCLCRQANDYRINRCVWNSAQFRRLGRRFGVRWGVVKTQESSDLMTVSRPKTEAELEVLQGYVERIYDRFIQLVAQSRSKEITAIEAIAQGRVWMGEDALELGLIDEFGGIEKSIRHAAQTSKPEERIRRNRISRTWEALSMPSPRRCRLPPRRSLLPGPVNFLLTKSFGIWSFFGKPKKFQ